jgi:hypothetical protein
MMEVEQSNADKQESRVFRRDSRSHPPSFNDPHWVQRPQRNPYSQGNGHHARSRNSYGKGSLRTSYLVPPPHQQQTQIGEDTCDLLLRKDPITRRCPPFLIGPPQHNQPFLVKSFHWNRPKKAYTLEDGLIKTVMNREESSSKESAADSPKETSADSSLQPSNTQPKRVVDSQIQTIIHRSRESTNSRNVHPTIAQIEDMHFYNINTRMELGRMEHHIKTLIKEAKKTQELFEKLEKERSGNPQPEGSSKSQLLYNSAYEIFIKCSMEEIEGLSHFLKQLQVAKGKEETHLEALENVKISDWDHYLITLQNINQQLTDILNTLSFQADSLPIGGAGPSPTQTHQGLLHGNARRRTGPFYH